MSSKAMTSRQLRTLKFFSLLFLLPGLAGLLVSAMVSTHYAESLPQSADVSQARTVPRNIDGVVVYQTVEEDRQLTEIEYGSVAVFVLGLGLGLVYLENWGSRQVREADTEDAIAGHFS